MTTYTIRSRTTGITLGQYQGDSPAEALDALARDSGYQDHAEACREMAGKDQLEITGPCQCSRPVRNDARLTSAARINPIVNAMARVYRDDFSIACESVVALVGRVSELEKLLFERILAEPIYLPVK